MVFCHNCGKDNKKGKFCKFCGQKLKTSKFQNKLFFFIIPIFILIIVEAIALNSPIEKNNVFGSIKRGNFLFLGIEFCGNGNCNADELYACKRDCVWCGDGACQKEEIGNCYEDCEWCGDGYCQKNEECSSCAKDCGNCKSSAYCGDNVCNTGECALGCYKDCSIFQCENGVCESQKGENCVTSPNDCKCKLNQKCNREKKSCEVISCGDSICDIGEFTTCPNDCKQASFKGEEVNPDTDYPIIFVHGHSVETEQVSTFSINAFTEFQNKLMSDGLYYDKGIILPNSELNAFNYGEWGRLDKPVSVRTTYYIGTLDSSGTFIQSSETSRSIKEYGERLGKVVDIVLHHTGKKRVIIIAHSMGGLVSRSYINNGGESKVDKLITIGTPNHGIWNLDGWNWGCSFSHEGVECIDMQHDSTFILQLNNVKVSPSIKFMTIAGFCGKSSKTDAEYDEVIRVNSVSLDGATNKVIKRDGCINGADTYHGYLISPSKVPDTYSYVIDFLNK